MSKEIKKRDGFFKSMKKYSSDKNYEERKKELSESDIYTDKEDNKALVLSAFLTLFLPAIGVLIVMVLLAFLVFRLF